MLLLFLPSGCQNTAEPPEPGIVATFTGGRVTRQELQEAIDEIEEAYSINDDMRKQVDEELNNTAAYRKIIEGIVLDRMIKQKIAELKLDKTTDFAHIMKHVGEELNISELHSRAHDRQIKVSNEEIRQRYNQNPARYEQRPLSEVSESIRLQIEDEKEGKFFEEYLGKLRNNAVITRYDELLKAPGPNEAELRMEYEQNRSLYSKQTYEEAASTILDKLRVEKKEKWFQDIRNRTLATVHGKSFTVGEFYDELAELDPLNEDLYQSFDSMKLLLDKMIDRMLIIEDTYDQMLSSETRNERGHIKDDLLKQIFHQEKIDDQIVVTEEEVQAFFDDNREALLRPPRVKINYLRISAGQTEPERKAAEKKVKEAYEKLKPGFFRKEVPFAQVALEYSEDAETAQNGGSIDGWISESSELLEELVGHGFHENVLGLGKNDVSRPFMFEGSYYIVQARDREDAQPYALEDVREAITAELEALKHEEMAIEIETTLLEQAEIIMFDEPIEAMLKNRELGE
jgi:parvulin-like peptidyl-prolyl isomerase